VIMLDEIDKIGASYQGDPASALLEVLDPEQNSRVPRPLPGRALRSLEGAVHLHRQPARHHSRPLLDRMETIRLSGYITEEKLAIAKHHLWPKQLKKAG
jgi:ATP-dependent Lon protease